MMRRWIITLLLTLHALLIGWIGWNASPNKTEVGHIGAAAYFWQTLRFDVFCVNPPLTRMITGIPVVLCDPQYDWEFYSSRPQDRSEWTLGGAFVKANRPEKVRWCFALARWSLIPLLLLGGYFGYRLSQECFGNAAGLVFLTLWCFSPMLLGLGATICPDAVAASLGIVAIYTFYQWLHKPGWAWAVIAGFCLGLLPLTKLTWIIAFGLWPLMWWLWIVPIYWANSLLKKGDRHLTATILRGIRTFWFGASPLYQEKRSLPLPSFRQLLAVLFLGLYTLNMGYMFDGTCRRLGQYTFISQSLRGSDPSATTGNRFAGTWLGQIPVPLPADFVQGIDTQRLDFERGLPSYLRGQWADHGWWYYYLYVAVVKMPLGTWLLVVLAVGVTVFDVVGRRRPPSPSVPLPRGEGSRMPSPPAPLPTNLRSVPAGEGRSILPSPSVPLPWGEGRLYASWRDEMVVLLPGVVLFVVVSSQTGFSAHSRYIVPVLPFLFVWVSKVGRVFAGASSLLKKGTGSEPAGVYVAECGSREVPVPLCQQAASGSLSATQQIARCEKEEDFTQRRQGARSPGIFAPWRLGVRLFSIRTAQVLVILALIWSVGSSLSIYPHSLSYFNELAAILPTPADATYPKPIEAKSDDRGILSKIQYALSVGPRNGPRHLLDSNIDWGQDLFYLEDWCESHPEAQPLKVAYWGNFPLEQSKVKSAGNPPVGPDEDHSDVTTNSATIGPLPGWYAVSVNDIYGRSRQYRYFLHFKPTAMAGYSIYMYHITLDEANRVRREMGLSELTEEDCKLQNVN